MNLKSLKDSEIFRKISLEGDLMNKTMCYKDAQRTKPQNASES